jgi:tripartite-type tricarboxylate transporter receptor subunit TctC
MDSFNRKRRAGLAAGASLAIGALAGVNPLRAHSWPSKPIRIIVGFAPGGTADTYARAIGEHWAQKLGQPVVVENRPGAGAMIALDLLAKSPADGYTIGLAPTSSYWQSRVLFRKLPFEPERDLAIVTLLPAGPLVFGVPASHPARTVTEFVEWARTNEASIGTFAPASTAHMVIEALNRSRNVSIKAIHYKGEAPMWVDTVSGQVQAGIGTYTTFSAMYSKGGLRPIGVTTMDRSPKLPEVPTLVEQGFEVPMLALNSWTSLVAPANTPDAVLSRLADLSVEFADTPRGLQFREQFGIAGKPTSLEEARRRYRDESPVWIETARSLGLTLD